MIVEVAMIYVIFDTAIFLYKASNDEQHRKLVQAHYCL